MILSPVSPRTQTVASVTTGERSILCKFRERNDQFRAVVKRAGLAALFKDRAYSRAWE